jgi:mono/diheme cytochrome c family protein
MLATACSGLLAVLVIGASVMAAEPASEGAAAPPTKTQATKLYNTHCSGCHGKDGKATTPIAKQLGVRDLTRSKTTDAEIAKQIREGKQGPGGKTLMPAFKDRLTEAEQQLLVDRVKELRKPPAAGPGAKD